MKKLLCICLIFLNCTMYLSAQKLPTPADTRREFQKILMNAKDGETVSLPEGKFLVGGSLWVDDKKNIVIKGKGKDKTIFSFKGQNDGAEGFKIINSKNITIQDLTVEDSKGDGIKTQSVDKMIFKNIKIHWTDGALATNGGYGLYPVQCKNVWIENCEVAGASDAGIYVGQSEYITVRNNFVHENVAGIEIENSTDAEVYENIAQNNTGGILVFDLPGLIKKKGGRVKVYKNQIIGNNHKNFAPKGNIVGNVPSGTGVMVLATHQVEIFNNTISQHKTVGTSIISYHILEIPIKDKEYYPYPTDIYIHDNIYQKSKKAPSLKNKLSLLIRLKFGKKKPDIIYDGIVDKNKTNNKSDICIQNNGDASFANLDAANKFKNLNRNIGLYNCACDIKIHSEK